MTYGKQNLESALPSAVLLGGDRYLHDQEAALTGAEKGISALQILLYNADQHPVFGSLSIAVRIRYKLSRWMRSGATDDDLHSRIPTKRQWASASW